MPVTFKVADHPSTTYWGKDKFPTVKDLITSKQPNKIFQYSVSENGPEESYIKASRNGFVYAAIEAYNEHHHLTIRPDDIWFAILSQLSLYINANSEKLRDHFVAHKGKKKRTIAMHGASMGNADFGVFARLMMNLLHDNVKDPDLRDWMMPTFSTSNVNDHTVAAILMMGSLQKYFHYGCTFLCGLPSVTLLGERSDYEDILKRIDKLQELGPEPTKWAELLRPILRNFIASFDEQRSADVHSFWSKIAHRSGGSGIPSITGWVTAFCFWGYNGKPLYDVKDMSPGIRSTLCQLDGVLYHSVGSSDIPEGSTSVPVTVNDNGIIYKTQMVAGSIGIQISKSGDKNEAGENKLDSMRSLSGWYMYEVDGEKNETQT
ncbi:hypothetical protein GQ44DRAFT_674240 [Phaeosphaeriaceae sp. PMI808]|nr:hypothetical protein GQ44DRAFT_674240 [Phaeosphaeriaceae sp. PMI808]